ncbi:MAG: histidine phosphatase family protein [Bacteroidetes bacterium]|nr:histidine phosphatase family protein [Bacteroidota bacterium]
MKKLLLVRHAKSGWESDIISDFYRKLSKQGNLDADEMANLIKNSITKIDRIVSSPAVRAISTAEYFANAFKVSFSQIETDIGLYEKGIKYFKKLIGEQDNSNECIMFVGHNPLITHLITDLTGAEISSLEACSVACIDFNISDWADIEKNNGKLIFIEEPFKL